MQFNYLKAPDGAIIASYRKDDKSFVFIEGKEYEIVDPVIEYDSDPEIRQMIKESEKDLENGEVYSTEEMIQSIMRGEM